jgi:hypothetical protein
VRHSVTEELRPSDSPTRSLVRRVDGARRSRGSLPARTRSQRSLARPLLTRWCTGLPLI